MPFDCYIDGVSIIAPGINSWQGFYQHVKSHDFSAQDFTIPDNSDLPSIIQRRATSTLKLALAAATEAEKMAGAVNPCASIFASSQGDTEIMNYLGETLATKERQLSPAKFHNSLHNAASGYWGIIGNNMQATMALAAGDQTFASSLLEAMLYCCLEQQAVLLVAYDLEPCSTLKVYIPIEISFTTALYLSPKQSKHSIASMHLELVSEHSPSTLANARLEKYRQQNPIAKSLPLLYALASGQTDRIILDYLSDRQLAIQYGSQK